MLGSAAGTAIPPSVRFALMAIALDVGAVASFALAVILGFNSGEGLGVLVLAGPVPWLATLAAIAASTRSLSESKKRLAKFVASALAVVSGILLVLCVVVLIALQGAE